jgi:hypothetical protein
LIAEKFPPENKLPCPGAPNPVVLPEKLLFNGCEGFVFCPNKDPPPKLGAWLNPELKLFGCVTCAPPNPVF